MTRTFVVNTNPLSAIASWEISPCLELPDYNGGTFVEAFESDAEAMAHSDEAIGGLFWGVYARLSDDAIEADLGVPAMHLRDFDSYDEAMRFVTLFNGVNHDD